MSTLAALVLGWGILGLYLKFKGSVGLEWSTKTKSGRLPRRGCL